MPTLARQLTATPSSLAKVPDFFQEDTTSARRQQVAWLRDNLSLDEEFFARYLDLDLQAIAHWRSGQRPLEVPREKRLSELWQMILHLLSLTNFQTSQASDLLSATASSPDPAADDSSVPWAGSTIRDYLQQSGPQPVNDVTQWLTSFRFKDRYS